MCHFTNEFRNGRKVKLIDYVASIEKNTPNLITHTFSEDKIKLVFIRNKLIEFMQRHRIDSIDNVLSEQNEYFEESIKSFLIGMYSCVDIDNGNELQKGIANKYINDNCYNLLYSYAKFSNEEKNITTIPNNKFLETLELVLNLISVTSDLRVSLDEEIKVIKNYN
jgi:hypothetical protein